jgi:hypothetical protein
VFVAIFEKCGHRSLSLHQPDFGFRLESHCVE